MAKPNGSLALRPDDLTPEEANLSAAAIDAFTVALGGRAALLETLQIANGSPEVDKVLRLLDDPTYWGWTLRRICALSGLTIADLFKAYKSALLVKAHLQATKIVVDALPTVVEDVMRRSQLHEVPCEACGGSGQLPTQAGASVACNICRGTGKLLKQPELDRQKVALELGQLLTKGGGISLTQQQNTLVAPGSSTTFGPGAIDQLQQAVAEILTPRARRPSVVVDAQIVPGPAEANTGGSCA
jgi:hypothetical protein